MAVTHLELEQFHEYVQAKLGQPEPPESLQECLNQWRQDREEAEAVDDVRTAMAEISAGAGVPLSEAMDLLRHDLNWYRKRS